MTTLEALAILEAALLECKKRNIDTPEVGEALDFVGTIHGAKLVGSAVPACGARRLWQQRRGSGMDNSRCFAQLSLESFRTPLNAIYGLYLFLASRKFRSTNRHDGQRP